MIRLMNLEDISDVVLLEEAILGQTLGFDMLKSYVDNDFCKAYVYEINNKIEGYCSYNFDGEILEICNICISLEYQNMGIGTQLLAYILNEAYINKAITAIIDVRENNYRAIHVYEKLGFKRINIRKGYYSNGDNALVLQKLFTPFMDLEDSYLQLFAKYEYNNGYVKIYDDIQTDKYYHNFYRVEDINLINELLKMPLGDNICQVQLENKIDYLETDEYEIDNNIYMSAYIANIMPIKDIKYNIEEVNIAEYNEFVDFLYKDMLQYGIEFSSKNAKRLADMGLINKKIKHLAIKHNNQFIATAHYYIYNDLAKIEDFFVLEEYQHNGYGQALFMGVIEDIKRNTNAINIILTADNFDTVKDMYYKMGFRKCGEYHLYRKK